MKFIIKLRIYYLTIKLVSPCIANTMLNWNTKVLRRTESTLPTLFQSQAKKRMPFDIPYVTLSYGKPYNKIQSDVATKDDLRFRTSKEILYMFHDA